VDLSLRLALLYHTHHSDALSYVLIGQDYQRLQYYVLWLENALLSMVDLCPVRDVSSQRKKVDDISFLQLTMTCLSPPRRILHKIWCGRLRQTRAVWKARRMRLEEVRRGDWCHLTQMLFFLFQFQSQGDVSSFLVIHPYFQSPPDCLCLRHRRLDLANTHQFWVPRGGRILRWIQIKEWSDRPKRGTKSVHFFFHLLPIQ
jgi:hypothetical protein